MNISSDSETSLTALREAVANLYNVQYRQGKESKYTYENVCIVPGGRAGLSRVCGRYLECLLCKDSKFSKEIDRYLSVI